MKSFKIFALVLLLCVAYLGFAFFPEASGGTRKIALLIRPDFQGECSFAYRIQAASKNLGWQSDIFNISQFKHQKHQYDFVINLVPGQYYKSRGTNHFLAVFHPIHHYFSAQGPLLANYRKYSGYLLSYPPDNDEINFSVRKMPYMMWYPTTQERPYKDPSPTALFYLACIWGNRFNDEKMQKFLNLLDKESFTWVYGKEAIKQYCPQAYRGPLPFDSDSVCETAHLAGVTLVLHSDDHNAYGVPSGRIFEAAAASTVIICDQNPFVKEHFKDSVLYINTDENAENILSQVKQHMNWILSNQEAAIEKARQAYAIYAEHFLLEDQLIRLDAFHKELLNQTVMR